MIGTLLNFPLLMISSGFAAKKGVVLIEDSTVGENIDSAAITGDYTQD